MLQIPQLNHINELAKRRRCDIYVVGGFLRDQKLNRTGYDFDFAVSKEAIAFAHVFSRRVKGAFVLLDDEHGSARVVLRQGEQMYTYDFTDFRAKTIQGDILRRDFTINTFCAHTITGKEYAHPDAETDLKKRVIRMVSTVVFKDDPLRLLRAYALAAQTGFKILSSTNQQIKRDAHLIERPAMERAREELFKILASERAYQTIHQMDQAGLLIRLIPHLSVMVGVKQGGYHHLDVWKHSLETLKQIEILFETEKRIEERKIYLDQEIGGGHSRMALLKLSALVHDIGKPQTRKKEKGRMTFHGHEHVGRGIARLMAKHLKLSVRERYYIEDAVLHHLRPGYLSNFKEPSSKAIFRYMRDTASEAAAIAMLAIADQRSTKGALTTASKAAHHESICRDIIGRYFQKAAQPKIERLITGHDIIKRFKLEPSPLVGKILGAIEEAQALGKVSSKKDAIALAATMV